MAAAMKSPGHHGPHFVFQCVPWPPPHGRARASGHDARTPFFHASLFGAPDSSSSSSSSSSSKALPRLKPRLHRILPLVRISQLCFSLRTWFRHSCSQRACFETTSDRFFCCACGAFFSGQTLSRALLKPCLRESATSGLVSYKIGLKDLRLQHPEGVPHAVRVRMAALFSPADFVSSASAQDVGGESGVGLRGVSASGGRRPVSRCCGPSVQRREISQAFELMESASREGF